MQMSAAKCKACEKNFNEEQRKSRQLDCGCIICEKCIRGIYNLLSVFQCRKHNITTQRAIETLSILHLVSQQVQNSRPQEFCQIHQWQLLGLYCPLDKVRICVQCQQEFHQGHECITEYEAIQWLKSYLESTFRAIKQRLGNYESTLDQGYRQLSQWQISRVERMVQVQQQVKQNIKQACQKIVKEQQCQIKNQIKLLKDTSDYYQQIGSQINAISNGSFERIVQVEEKRNQLDKIEITIQEKLQNVLQSSEVYRDNLSEQALWTNIVVDLMQHCQSSTVYQSCMSQVSQIKQLQLAMKRLSKEFQGQFRQQERKEREYIDQIFYLEQQVSNYQSQANSFTQQIIHQNRAMQDLENKLVQVKQESVQVIQQKALEYQIQLKNKDDQLKTSQSQYVKETQELQQKMVNLQKELAASQQFSSQLQGQQQRLVQENFSYQEQMRILLNEQESLKSTLKQLEISNKTSSDQLKLQESQLKELATSLEKYKTQAQQLKDFGWDEIVLEPIIKYVITKRVVPPRISVYRRIFYYTNKVQSYQLENVGKVCSYRSVSQMTPIYGSWSSTYQIDDELLIQVGGRDTKTYLNKILQISVNVVNGSNNVTSKGSNSSVDVNSVIKVSSNLIQPRAIKQMGYDNERQLYILGGKDPTSYSASSHDYCNYYNSFEVYDRVLNKVRELPCYKDYIHANGIFFQGERVWVIGGKIQNSKGARDFRLSSQISAYDISLSV